MQVRLPATLAAALCTFLVGVAPARAEVTTTLYDLPAQVTAGTGLTSDAAGDVWFSTGDANSTNTPRVGRFVPAQGVAGTAAGTTLWPTPLGATCCATQVRALDFDDDHGRLWFVRNDGTYGFGDAALLRTGGQNPFQAAVHPQRIGMTGVAYDAVSGRTWLSETDSRNTQTPADSGYFAGNRIASANAALGLTELRNLAQQNGEPALNSSRYDAQPRGVAPDGKGEAWFVESNPGLPGWRIGHTKGSGYEEYSLACKPSGAPCSGSYTGTGPTDVTVGKDGAVWFTNVLDASVGRLDPTALTFTSFSLAGIDPALATSQPLSIRTAADGSIWVAVFRSPYVNQTGNAVVKFTPASGATPTTATVFKTGNDAPLAVEPTAGGDVYYLAGTSTGTGRLGRISGATDGSTPVPMPSPTPGSSPTPLPGGSAPSPGEAPGGSAPSTTSPPPGSAPTPGTTTIPGSTTTPGVTVVAVGQASVARITPPTTDTVTVRQVCVGPPSDRCSLVYLLDSNEYVNGFPGTKLALAPKKAKKPKTVELGRTEVTLQGGQTKDVKVALSKKARTLLAKRKTLKARLRVMERQADGSLKEVRSKALTFKAKKARK